MADEAHVATDKLLEKLEKKIAREYKLATKEMQAKLEAYLQETEANRQKQESLLKAGKITKQEYSDWCYRHAMVGQRWEEMKDVLAADMTHANEIAKGIMQGTMPDIYALNANYGTYQIEHDGQINTGFTLYNHDTAQYLLGDQRQLMPQPSAKKAAEIKANKDMQWNMKKIQSAVLQGVLQGEAPHQVADRLMQVGQMNYNAAVRYARTMGTSAQNAGRYEAYRRAKNLGVDLTIEWNAILDHRTRHAHRMMHGQRTEVDKPFYTPDGYTIYYPADCTGESNAPQKEIWNCRCTLLSWVKGFEGDTIKDAPGMDGMSFTEWQNAKPFSDTEADKTQYEKYVNKLGKDAPKSISEFQKIKYTDPAKYAELKTKYHEAIHPPKQTFTSGSQSATINQKRVNPFTPEAYSTDRKSAAKKFGDRYDADSYYRPQLDDTWKSMSEREKYSVWEYTHNSNPINKSLSGYHDTWSRSDYIGVENTDWGHEDAWRHFDTPEFAKKFGKNGTDNVDYYGVVQNLTNAIEKNELQEDGYFTRGGGSGGLAGLLENGGVPFDWAKQVIERGSYAERDKLQQLVIDQTFQEHSFLSTGVAKDAGFGSTSDIKYSIYAPKGTKAIYCEPQSYYGDTIGHNEKIYKAGQTSSGVGYEAEMLFQRGTTYRITDIEFHRGNTWVKMEVVDQPDYFTTGAEDTFNGGATVHKKR